MAEKNIVPNLETKATDGNPVFTPRQWLKRFKQFTKREHKIDFTPLLKGEYITDSGWGVKEQTYSLFFNDSRIISNSKQIKSFRKIRVVQFSSHNFQTNIFVNSMKNFIFIIFQKSLPFLRYSVSRFASCRI